MGGGLGQGAESARIVRKTLGQHEIAAMQTHRHRPDGGLGQSHHHVGACVGRMDLVGLAGLPYRRYGQSAPDGGRADLCAPLFAVHAGGHRR
jgi:hypothetical protein